MNRRLTAEENFPRVDVFLSTTLGITRSAAKKLADEGKVRIGGVPVKASREGRRGETVEVELEPPRPIRAVPQDIPVEIVYEDEAIAVVNKPQGMTVHAGNGNTEGTLVNALLYRLDSLSGINGELRPGIVHRIDKDTSGLLVVAKNDAAHRSLSEQIAQKTCGREYLALAEGHFAQIEGKLVTQIGRNPKDRLQMAVLPAGRGRRAETDYRVVERFVSNDLVWFRLHTGRTHQIRVHAKYLGHPLVGDPVYGYKKQRFALGGQLLHAFRLEFSHPLTGDRMVFTAPLPDYFSELLLRLRAEDGGESEVFFPFAQLFSAEVRK